MTNEAIVRAYINMDPVERSRIMRDMAEAQRNAQQRWRTKEEVTMSFGAGSLKAVIRVPPGTRCHPAGPHEFFVDDLSWLDKNSITWHDAYYYGIRLRADQVEEVR